LLRRKPSEIVALLYRYEIGDREFFRGDSYM